MIQLETNTVYLKQTKTEYNNSLFTVGDVFEELHSLNIALESDIDIYKNMRELFKTMGLDKKHQNSKNWNPFSDFIKKGDHVLIKPNLVKDINYGPGSIESLITNFSVLRPIIDYTILALDGTGKIIVGDAPVQECNFEELKKINNLEKNIEEYKKYFSDIFLVDFRRNQNPSIECMIVELNEKSSFSDLDQIKKEYAITNYNLNLMNEHHKDGKHEYIVPVDVLDADIIINVPKPKTHRKAGMTACMKNFVGINGNKECLPHHRSGSPTDNGDEFPENNWIKKIHSLLSKQSYRHNRVINFIRKIFRVILRKLKLDRYLEGSWYGNDTIWRTILDLNKLVLYADKSGVIQKKVQRTIFNVADMIIAGEKEGPLLPSDKKVGMLVAGYNALDNDYIICQLMGFEPSKIKYIANAYNLSKYKLSLSAKNVKVIKDGEFIENLNEYNFKFKATDGWKDYLEK